MPVRDVSVAVAFYRDRLGFEMRAQWPGGASMQRDAAVVHLWEAGDREWAVREDFARQPVSSGAETFLAGTASFRVETDDVERLFTELETVGVLHPVSHGGPQATSFGTVEFAALDCDGNLITFFRRQP